MLRDDQLCLHCDLDLVYCLPLPGGACQKGKGQHTFSGGIGNRPGNIGPGNIGPGKIGPGNILAM